MLRIMLQNAWDLLTRLLSLDPARRPGAAESLLGPYLNSECTEGELPMPAAEPWSLEALMGAAGAGSPRVLAADECALPAEEEEEVHAWDEQAVRL